MVEKLDYRVVEVKCTLIFDYMEEKPFEEFYMKFKKLCDNHNIHMSNIIRKEDILPYEVEE